MAKTPSDITADLAQARDDLVVAQSRIAELEKQLTAAPVISPESIHYDRYPHLLDNLLESCQVIGFDWRYLYLNDVAAQAGRQPKEELLGHTVMEKYPGIETTEMFATMRRCMEERRAQDAEFEFTYPDQSKAWFEFRIQPVPEGIFILTLNITERKLADEHIRRLNRTLSVLSDINQAIVRIHDIDELFKQACKIAVNKGAFQMAWIGMVDVKAKRVNVVAHAGLSDEKLAKIAFFPMDENGNQGLTGAVVRTGERLISNDIEHDSRMSLWHEDALRLGYRSCIALPLIVANQVQGVFHLYAQEANFFDSEEIRLMDEMAMDVSFAMTVAAQERQRQQADDSVKRYAQRLEVLHQIDREIIASSSINTLLEIIVKYMRQLIPCPRVSAALIDPVTHESVIYAIDVNQPTNLGEGIRTILPPAWFEGFDDNHVRVIHDLRPVQDTLLNYKYLLEEGILSTLQVLLIDHDKPIGVFGLSSDQVDFFNAEHQVIASEVGNQLTIAIRQLRLTESLEQRVIERTAELNESKRRVESILNSSTDAVILAYLNTGIQQTNDTFNTLFSCKTDDYFGKPLTVLVSQEDQELLLNAVQKVISEQRGLTIDVRARLQDDTYFDAEMGISAMITGDRGRQGFVCSVRDITDRKKSEEILRSAFKKEKELGELKSRFVSMASHEFRTPLATILAVTETLTAYRYKMEDAQIDQRLAKIQDQVSHLKNVIDDVLQIAQIQAHRVTFNPVRVDMDAMCRSVLDEFQSHPNIKHQLVYECDSIFQDAVLDKRLMRQIISNLMSNAVKYSPDGNIINVSLEERDNHLIFKIIDQGIGIPEADLKHLFEPFYRAENVGTISGTGLGLVITKESVEMHGGTITVESEVGIGTTFIVDIPLNRLDNANTTA